MSLTLDILHYNKTGERVQVCGWNIQRRDAARQAQSDKGVTLCTDPIRNLKRSHPNVNPKSLFANAYIEGWDKPEMASCTYWHGKPAWGTTA